MICFTSEGKGRVESEFGKYVFNYDSELNFLKKKYFLATQFPLIGEEVIEIEYANENSFESFKKSKFFQNLLKNAQKNNQEELANNLAQIFVQGLSSYLNLYDQSKIKTCTFPDCEIRLNEKIIFGKNDVIYWRQFATNLNLKITHTNLSDGKFKKQVIELLQSESKLLTMTLFSENCTAQK